MSKVFISYSRHSQEIARSLVSDIQALGYVVWFDQELSGGHAWWDQILATIRDSDIFVFLLDPDGLNSVACQLEFGYAAALGKPVLPVLIADRVSTNLLPPELSRLQFIDYRKQDRQSAFALGRALAGIPPASALPDPLPAPPEVPVSYLGGLTRKIETTPGLSYEEQSALVLDLRRGLRDPKTADDARVLLRKLRARRDCFVAIAEEVDELLGGSRAAKEDTQEKPVPKPAPEPVRVLPTVVPQPPARAATATPRARSLGCFLVPALVVLAGIGYFVFLKYGSMKDSWTDPATGFTWTKQDSHVMNQPDAVAYCAKLRLGGYTDWRLPTIEQLAGIRDGSATGRTKGGLKADLPGWEWSSSRGTDAGHAMAFPFDLGVAMSFVVTDSAKVRALCVRGVGVQSGAATGGQAEVPVPTLLTPTPDKSALQKQEDTLAGLKAQKPPAGRTKVNPKDGLTYVWIQPGTFMMGCSQGDSECNSDEKPTHQVTITSGFWMGQSDVTQAAWHRVKGTDPSYYKGAQLPVESVNWNEAQSYCQAVGMRLPTEAEWEYAARAGSTASRYGDIDQIAWYKANSGEKTHEVMQKQPNAWGLYDMLGNVWQWTADWYADKYSANSEPDPHGPKNGQYRVLRGGSWYPDPAYVRASCRDRNDPEARENVYGFRCVGN